MKHTVLALALAGLAVSVLVAPAATPYLLALYVLARIAQTALTNRASHKGWTRIR